MMPVPIPALSTPPRTLGYRMDRPDSPVLVAFGPAIPGMACGLSSLSVNAFRSRASWSRLRFWSFRSFSTDIGCMPAPRLRSISRVVGCATMGGGVVGVAAGGSTGGGAVTTPPPDGDAGGEDGREGGEGEEGGADGGGALGGALGGAFGADGTTGAVGVRLGGVHMSKESPTGPVTGERGKRAGRGSYHSKSSPRRPGELTSRPPRSSRSRRSGMSY